MNPAPDDPLDKLWTSEQRAAARERCREQALEAARATVAGVPAHLVEAMNFDLYAADVVADRLRSHDEWLQRARDIIGAPEAAGREGLARHLIVSTAHSAMAAVIILRDAGTDILTLPAGGERKERLAAMRRAASLEGAA